MLYSELDRLFRRPRQETFCVLFVFFVDEKTAGTKGSDRLLLAMFGVLVIGNLEQRGLPLVLYHFEWFYFKCDRDSANKFYNSTSWLKGVTTLEISMDIYGMMRVGWEHDQMIEESFRRAAQQRKKCREKAPGPRKGPPRNRCDEKCILQKPM